MNFIKDLLQTKLTSRKFLMSVAAIIFFASNGQHELALAVILGYLGVEGAGDALERFKRADVPIQPNIDPDMFEQVAGFEDDGDVDMNTEPMSGITMFDETKNDPNKTDSKSDDEEAS